MGAGVVERRQQGRRGRRRGKPRAMAEINVTPFVGVPVELPETAAESLPMETEEPLTVTLAADGRILIQTTETPANELVTRLQAIAGERESNKIFLRADGAIPYETVMQVMGALNAGGFRNIGLVTDTGGPTLDEDG